MYYKKFAVQKKEVSSVLHFEYICYSILLFFGYIMALLHV